MFTTRWIFLLCGCTFAAEGTAAGTDTDTDGSTGAPSIAVPPVTSATASSTSGGSTSTSGVDGSSRTSSSAESSSSSAESTSRTSSSAESSSSSTGGIAHAYVPCWPPTPDDGCAGSCVVDEAEVASACSPGCAGGCPDAPEAEPACLTELAAGAVAPVCVLPCGAGCPLGMDCEDVAGYVDDQGQPISVCMWAA